MLSLYIFINNYLFGKMFNYYYKSIKIKFNAKYRRKLYISLQILSTLLLCLICKVNAFNCTSDINCMNGGTCRNSVCICPDGWQGPDCQFCGGKIRLTEPEGIIHDGFGNYSVSVKCSWLIDARNANWTNRNGANSIQKPAKIRLHLEEFATECGWDHLYIFDGDSVESPLLAVYSGLMYKKNFSIRRVPEIVAENGSALLHFFSDDAYNMSGFNISYKINGCPTNDSSVDCSGKGVCVDGICTCDAQYTGEACNIQICPNNCSYHLRQGACKKEAHVCECRDGFAGNDCSQINALGVWSTISLEYSLPPPGSASHGATVWRDTLHIIGGESYGRGELLNMYDFNGRVWETVHMESNNKSKVPELRYAGSTVMFGDKIFMYGGVVPREGISGELWAFDVNAKTWENITVKTDYCNGTFAMCGPLKVAGHTATLVPGFGDRSNYQFMVVIFGHSPQFGYLNTVQEYNFGTREWKIVETYGYAVKGGYGHSAAYDTLTEKIYIYGGIVSESEATQILSNKLYAYDPVSRVWTLLTSAPSARFLHTANFINLGLMMVFGGNTHNDTSQSYGAKCYSKDILIYDVVCDSWHINYMPNDLRADMARFGHSAVIFENSLYIYGGFDGQLLSDMLKYTPGNCSYFEKEERCLNGRPGVKCVWDSVRNSCIPVKREMKEVILRKDQYEFITCPQKSRITLTTELLLDVTRCVELSNCQSCVSSSFGCAYCGNGTCSKDKCRESNFFVDSLVYNITNITKLDQCPEESGSLCPQLHCCNACIANSNCYWDIEAAKCKGIGNKTLDPETQCPTPCAIYTNCSACTDNDCIWCQNQQRCVDRNAYTASFPYGQCREWTTHSSKCRTVPSAVNSQINGEESDECLGHKSCSQCGSYKTCNQCRDDPACGWCDDGSATGLGKCLPGGASGSQSEFKCNKSRWHFTHCPDCQCNGHSICPDKFTCKQPCANLTVGRNCDKCRPGYWGNPINGGTCQKCECNGQGTLCHSDTGKCFCHTKGMIGDHCEKCDLTNHYHGDATKGSCYYDLTIDYQFTFNLSKKEDRHFTQINFRNSPAKPDIDADFSITCSVLAKMNITVRTAGGPEKTAFSGLNCSNFRHRFSKTEYHFGSLDNDTLTTFYVYVYDFQPPLWIQIAFSQYPKLNLQQFFITFSSCFLLLLLMAAVLWKIKQKYDMFRRRQRLFVEMEQMASRPFSQVLVEIENRENIDLSQTIESITTAKKRKKDCPSPIALEPCSGNRAAVLSLLVRLPTGGLQHAPPGQAAGLAVASALVTLGNPRRPSIEHPKEPKTKRKQSQHPDSCT
ncbi:attractin-like protein 1 [Condylostylus longicornis]|uniref:attractin-like protein 1 n=1 Tax=Condylostylus longicornis TaxID=2530218 RepID=UPI00244DA7B9|nr:attractin-like protein 1 [Condylostylus longicornis]